MSFIGELILHVKWWDYSKLPLNINGRICLLYSIFWGCLALYLMISLNPRIDRLINYTKTKINTKILQMIVIGFIIFIFIDCILTAIALYCFNIRVIKENNISVKNQEYIVNQYNKIYNNENRKKIIMRYANNEKMLIIFPRITISDYTGNILYIKDFYPEIKTYYYKLNSNQ